MSPSAQAGTGSGADRSALHLLLNLGWQLLSTADALSMRASTREVVLRQRLIEVLQTRRFEYKGDLYPLSPSGIDQILRQVQTLHLGEGLLQANERMYRTLTLGVTVTEFMPDGKKHQPTIALIDWQDAGHNRWDLTPALQVLCAHGAQHRCVDLVAYVNGLPLAVIEVDARGAARAGPAPVSEGIARHLRHQRPDEIAQLFVYAQLLIAVGGAEGRYGTTLTPPNQWARWREEEFTDAQLSAWARRPACAPSGSPAAPPSPQAGRRTRRGQASEQDRLLAALLHPQRLLALVRQFILFDRRSGKLIARCQQFFGVRALMARLGSRRFDGSREGGVVWHTTGSGKSLTMVFLTKALMLNPGTQACRVLVVTDRLDLQDQLARNFVDSGAFGSAAATRKEGEKAKVGTGRELARRIGQGTERIVFTLIHKFATATRLGECYNPSADLIVLVDEGHRSHGGETHEHMRKALPRAAYVAFTGTPLLRQDKTTSRFGPIVHAYPMRRAVEDGTVTPLLYEQRVPELAIDEAAVNRWFHRVTAGLSEEQAAELKRRFARTPRVHGAARRIELIAWDIAQHFSENIRKPGLGLKGQVATASKWDAILYKRFLDESGLVSSAIVMSPPDHPEGDAELHESHLPEVRRWWNEQVGRDAEAYEARVLQGFGSGADPDLLIVVDRLLTGFDEPRNTVLYIDKPLKDHSLIQAVARVNRLHEAKRYGLLVDYRGMLPELDAAVRAYQDLESRTQGGYDLVDIEGLYRPVCVEYKRLPALHKALWALFDEVQDPHDAEALRQALMPRQALDENGQAHDARQTLRDHFDTALTAFGLCLQTALSSRSFFAERQFSPEQTRTYQEDLRFFVRLRTVARQDALEQGQHSVCEAQFRRMLDRQVIGQRVREPQGVYVVHRLGQPAAAEGWSDERTRSEASLVRARVKKQVEQELADDPYAQKVFSDLLEHAIAEAEALFDRPLKQYALFKRFEERVLAREVGDMPQSLGDDPQARAYFGICRMVLGEEGFRAADPEALARQARHIDEAVRQAMAEHSLNPQNIEAAIRQALLPAFFGLMGLDKARQAVEQVMQVIRVGLARGGQ